MTHTLRFLFLALLVPFVGLGQGVTQILDLHPYRDNSYTTPELTLSRADSSATVSATLYYTKSGPVVSSPLQPIVIRSGRMVKLYWPTTTGLPQTAFLELKAGNQTRFVANVATNKNPNYQSPPGSITFTYPVSDSDVYQNLRDQLFIYLF